MSLCHRLKRRCNSLKNIVYGYDESAFDKNKEQEQTKVKKGRANYSGNNTRQVYQNFKVPAERRCNYCIPKGHSKYEAYGIEFETRQERDAFECKMESMEIILEQELRDIKQQHDRLRREHFKGSFQPNNNINHKDTNSSQTSNIATYKNKPTSEVASTSNFVTTNDDPLIEEVSLLNDFQDVYQQLCKLSTDLQKLEKVLKIEVRERALHPEPRLIHIKAPEDQLSEQMKNDGGLRYCSSDSSVQQISYDTLPPPLTLRNFLANQQQDDT